MIRHWLRRLRRWLGQKERRIVTPTNYVQILSRPYMLGVDCPVCLGTRCLGLDDPPSLRCPR